MTVKRAQAPYGRWESPITVDLLTGSSIAITDFKAAGKNDLYFLESRPYEAGRSVLVKMDGDGKTTDVVSQEANVRTKVHEYGGCAFAINITAEQKSFVYSDFKDSRLYYASDLADPCSVNAITPSGKPLRFASYEFHPHAALLMAVCEDHTVDSPAQVQNYLVLIDLEDTSMRVLVRGADFYSSPKFSPDGRTLIWKEWMHPEMPWTCSKLFSADFDMSARSISNVQQIAGGNKTTPSAVTQPLFTTSGTLIYASDKTGYQQLYSSNYPYTTHHALTDRIQGDFAGNDWTFGNSSYTIIEDLNEVIASYTSQDGMTLLARINIETGKLESIEHPFLAIKVIEGNPAFPELLYITGSTHDSDGLFSFYAKNGDLKLLKSVLPKDAGVEQAFLSLAQPITIPLADGKFTYGFYYSPTSPLYGGPANTLPPLLMRIHGGPTSFAAPTTSLEISYWTSRGYAFFNLNYTGSSGFGRKYMLGLNSNWGVSDVSDALNAAKYLAANGYCDVNKMAIDGGSAGGYTVLNVLCTSTTFAAGCSRYGISDLEALSTDTHKFESQYLFALVGGTFEEIPETYRDRSPLHRARLIQTPVLVQQGTEDRVVPINQARRMVEEIEAAGGTVELQVFEGEGHGFRSAKAQRESLLAQTAFFEKHLDL